MTKSPARTIDALNRDNRRLRSIIDGVLLDCREYAEEAMTGAEVAAKIVAAVTVQLAAIDGNRR